MDCLVTSAYRVRHYCDIKSFYCAFLSQSGSMAFAANRGDTTWISILNQTLRAMPESLMNGVPAAYANPVQKLTLIDFIKEHAAVILPAILVYLRQAKETERNTAVLREKLQKSYEELKQALVAAEYANQAKTDFPNNMSHDIRTPMNAIIGFTSLAAAHLEEQEANLPDDIKTIISGQIHAKQLELYMDIMDVSDEGVFCDKTRLNQVLLNLLSNAIKFTAPGGTVYAKVTCTGPWLDRGDLTAEYHHLASTATHDQIRVTGAGDILVAGQQGFGWGAPDGTVREFREEERVVSLNSAAMDYEGNLWLASSSSGLIKYSRGRVLLELSDGSMAVGTQDGLGIIQDGAVVRTYGKEDGVENLSILCLTQAADGTLLAGSDGDGIYAIRDGRVTNHGFGEGLNEGGVIRILADDDGGGYFVSAGSSLYYWKDDAFVKLENFQKGAGSIFDFYDWDGRLWLLQNNGVLAVDKAQLLAGEDALTISYGVHHGLTGPLNANTLNYLAAPDGRLYMATRSGVSVFAFHGVDTPLPKTAINSIRVDDTVYEHPEALAVSSPAQRITVDFAALSYASTSSLRLAYYLEGFDQKETVLDDRYSGTISYTNLPGGYSQG